MSILKLTALFCCAALTLPLWSVELLENADFSKKRPDGYPVNWSPLNGTKGKAEGNVMTLENPKGGAVMIQHVRPRPEKRVLFSVEVKCDTPCKVRAYLESVFMVRGKQSGSNSGAAWKNCEPGKWMTLSGELAPLPEGYKDCYLAIWNDTGKPVQIRNPHVELGSDIFLPNADFSKKNAQGAIGWVYRGQRPKDVTFQGNSVRLADGILIQRSLPLFPTRQYKLTFAMKGAPGSEGRAYVEWSKVDAKGKIAWGGGCSSGWMKTERKWRYYSVLIKLPTNCLTPYIVLCAKDKLPVEFMDLKIEKQ